MKMQTASHGMIDVRRGAQMLNMVRWDLLTWDGWLSLLNRLGNWASRPWDALESLTVETLKQSLAHEHEIALDILREQNAVQAEKMKQEQAVVAFFEERKLSAELFDDMREHQRESQKGKEAVADVTTKMSDIRLFRECPESLKLRLSEEVFMPAVLLFDVLMKCPIFFFFF
ncbi:Potassium voltage-gated channel subfamily H member 2 [Durusdinium trenchii]|uniref:Potassium voltage-gated channel subfamily H member 2 n=1 Tax=Durusdinium trenchii TaxID=1381693 RepID=A0ABP0J400_9DINO